VLAAAKFWKTTAGVAHDPSSRFIYEADTAKRFYNANCSVAGSSVQFATTGTNLRSPTLSSRRLI
jgi:hypothetical protein